MEEIKQIINALINLDTDGPKVSFELSRIPGVSVINEGDYTVNIEVDLDIYNKIATNEVLFGLYGIQYELLEEQKIFLFSYDVNTLVTVYRRKIYNNSDR